MKYFTSRLWANLNNELLHEREEADIEWNHVSKLYWERFLQIEKRIPTHVVKYLKSGSFHDSKLVSIDVNQNTRNYKKFIDFRMHLSRGPKNWMLMYSNVTNIQLNYKDLEQTHGFSDWGYDELLAVDENYLSHEILFASGATIYLEFPNKKISIIEI